MSKGSRWRTSTGNSEQRPEDRRSAFHPARRPIFFSRKTEVTMAQIPLSETASADRPENDKLRDDKTRQIAPDVAYRQIAIVNVIFFGRPGAGDGNSMLIDAGMSGAASD